MTHYLLHACTCKHCTAQGSQVCCWFLWYENKNIITMSLKKNYGAIFKNNLQQENHKQQRNQKVSASMISTSLYSSTFWSFSNSDEFPSSATINEYRYEKDQYFDTGYDFSTIYVSLRQSCGANDKLYLPTQHSPVFRNVISARHPLQVSHMMSLFRKQGSKKTLL